MCQSIKTLLLVIWSEVILPIPCEDTRFEGQLMPYPSGCQQDLVLILALSPAGQSALHMPPPYSGLIGHRSEGLISKAFLSLSGSQSNKLQFFSHTRLKSSLYLFLSSTAHQKLRGKDRQSKKIKLLRWLLWGSCWIIVYSSSKAKNDEFNITQRTASCYPRKTVYATQRARSSARSNYSFQLWGKWNDRHQAHILEATWIIFFVCNFIWKCPKEGESSNMWISLLSQDYKPEWRQLGDWAWQVLVTDDKSVLSGVKNLGHHYQLFCEFRQIFIFRALLISEGLVCVCFIHLVDM